MKNRKLVCLEFGPPESLGFEESETPSPGESEVIVQVAAAGVGFFDALMVQGLYQIKPPLPYYPGSEFSGLVTAVGSGVENIKTGDRVMGLTGGTFADFISVPARLCTPIPNGLSDEIAAGFCANYSTALFGLRECGHLQVGETLLVLGASGGIGSSAIAVAKAMGARVIAGASSQTKLDSAMEAGADAGVLYSEENWRQSLRDTLGSDPLTLVYDPVGGDLSETAFRCLSPGGRFLVVGFASGTIPRIPLNLPLLKQSAIVGVDWGGAARDREDLTNGLLHTLSEWIEDESLKAAPVTAKPLSQAPDVLTKQVSGNLIGKWVLQGGE
ncbi:MAG: NADPH:quinone oxidoreductase family protein [Myxococcota bacterium]